MERMQLELMHPPRHLAIASKKTKVDLWHHMPLNLIGTQAFGEWMIFQHQIQIFSTSDQHIRTDNMK